MDAQGPTSGQAPQPPRPRSRKRIHTTLKWALPVVPASSIDAGTGPLDFGFSITPAPSLLPLQQHHQHQSRAHAFLSDRIIPLARQKVRKTAEIVIPPDAARSAIPPPLPIPIPTSSSSRPTHTTSASTALHPPIKTGTAPPPRPRPPAAPTDPLPKPTKTKPYDPAAVQAYMKRKRAKLRTADPLDTIKDLDKPLHHVPSPPPDARRATVPETKRSELVEFMEKKRALERVAALRAKRAEEDKERGKRERLRRLEEFRRRQREEAEKEKQARAASTTPTPAETRPVSTTPTPMQQGDARAHVQAQPSAQPQFSFTQNGAYLAGGHYQQSQQPQQQQHRESHTSFAPTPTLWSPPGQPHPYQPPTPHQYPPSLTYTPIQPLLPIPSPSLNLNPHRPVQPAPVPAPTRNPTSLSRLHLDLQSILEDDLAHFNSTPTSDSTVRVLAPTSPPQSSPPSMVHTPYNFAISLAATDGGRSRAGSALGRLGMSQESLVEYSTVTSHELDDSRHVQAPQQPQPRGVSEVVDGDGETTTKANAFVVTTAEAVEFAAGLVMQETSAGDGVGVSVGIGGGNVQEQPLVMPHAEPDYFSPLNVFARAMRKVPMPEVEMDASWVREMNGGELVDSRLVVQDVREQAVHLPEFASADAAAAITSPREHAPLAESKSSSASDRRRRTRPLSSTPTILPPCDVSSILGSTELPPPNPNHDRAANTDGAFTSDEEDNRMAVSSLIAAHDRALFDHESLQLASVLLDSIAMFAATGAAPPLQDQDPDQIQFQFSTSTAGGPPVLPLVPMTASLVGDVSGYVVNDEQDASAAPAPAPAKVPVMCDSANADKESRAEKAGMATQTPSSPVRDASAQSPSAFTAGAGVQTSTPTRIAAAVQTDLSWTEIDRASAPQPQQPSTPAPANETAQLLQAIARMFADNQHLVRDLVTSQMSHQIRQLEARIEVLQAQTHPQPATVVYAPQQQPVQVPPPQPQVIVLPMPTSAAAATSTSGRHGRVTDSHAGYRQAWRRGESRQVSLSSEDGEEDDEMARKYGRLVRDDQGPSASARRKLSPSPSARDPQPISQSPSPHAHSIGMESTDLSGSLPSPISPTSHPLTTGADSPKRKPVVAATAQSPSDSFVPTQSLLAALNQGPDGGSEHASVADKPSVYDSMDQAKEPGEYADDFVNDEDVPESESVRVSHAGSVSVAQSSHEDGTSATTSQSIIKSGSLAASVIMSTSIQVSEISESAIVEEEEHVVDDESAVVTESAHLASGSSHAASAASVVQSDSIRSLPSASIASAPATATVSAVYLRDSGSVQASASAHSTPASASQASAPRTASATSIQELGSADQGALDRSACDTATGDTTSNTTEAAAADIVESETSIGHASVVSSVRESIASVLNGDHPSEQVDKGGSVMDMSDLKSAVGESQSGTSSPSLSHAVSEPDLDAPAAADKKGHTSLSHSIVENSSTHPQSSTAAQSKSPAPTSTSDHCTIPSDRPASSPKDEPAGKEASAEHVLSQDTSIAEEDLSVAELVESDPHSTNKSGEIAPESIGPLAGSIDKSLAEVDHDVEATHLDESFSASAARMADHSSLPDWLGMRKDQAGDESLKDEEAKYFDESFEASASSVVAPLSQESAPAAQAKDNHEFAETVSDTSIPQDSEFASTPPAAARDQTTAVPIDSAPRADAARMAANTDVAAAPANIDSSHVQISHSMHDISAVGITRSTSELFRHDGADSIPVSPTAKVFDTLSQQEHAVPAPLSAPMSQVSIDADKEVGGIQKESDVSGEIAESISGAGSEDSRVAESVEREKDAEATSEQMYSMDFESADALASEAHVHDPPAPDLTVPMDDTVARLLHHDTVSTTSISIPVQESMVRSDPLIAHTGDNAEDHQPASPTPPELETTIVLEETIPVESQHLIDLALVEPAADALFDDLLREMSMDVAAIEQLQLDETNILEAAANKLFTIEYAERYLHYLLIHHHDEISASTPIAPRPHPIYKNDAANTYLADLASEFRDAYVFRLGRIGSDGKEPSVPSFYFFRELMATIKQDIELSVARADDVLPWVVQELREERKRSFGVQPQPLPPAPHPSLASRKSLEQFQTEKLELAVNELLEQLMEETAATALHLDHDM